MRTPTNNLPSEQNRTMILHEAMPQLEAEINTCNQIWKASPNAMIKTINGTLVLSTAKNHMRSIRQNIVLDHACSW